PRSYRENFIPIAMPLAERVEDEVVGDFEHRRHFGRFVGGGKDVDFAAEFLVSETRLLQSARSRADEVVAQERVEAEAGKGLLGEEDLRPGLILDPLQDLAIATE